MYLAKQHSSRDGDFDLMLIPPDGPDLKYPNHWMDCKNKSSDHLEMKTNLVVPQFFFQRHEHAGALATPVKDLQI